MSAFPFSRRTRRAPAVPWRRRRAAVAAASARDRFRVTEEGLSIDVEPAGPARWIRLVGELSASTADILADHLDRALVDRVEWTVVDPRGLSSIDEPSVGALLAAHLRAADAHVELRSIRGPAEVQRVVDRLDAPFRYFAVATGNPVDAPSAVCDPWSA